MMRAHDFDVNDRVAPLSTETNAKSQDPLKMTSVSKATAA